MIALLQRVTASTVSVTGEQIASIGPGLLVLVGVTKDDAEQNAKRLAQRIVDYRMFADTADRMNLSVKESGGELLLVPQFTLAADTGRGRRPSFATAAAPQHAEQLFDCFTSAAHAYHPRTACGRFGADMQVQLTNDGPVTFWLES